MKAVRWIVLVAIAASLFALGTFIDNFGIGYWDSLEKWAQTGDFFGGVLNPIFAFLSLILIAYTLTQNKQALIQSRKAIEQSEKALAQNELALKTGNRELELSRIEYSKSVKALKEQVEQFNFQRFENTFFNMLSLQSEILIELEFNNESLNLSKNPNKDSTRSRKVFGSILRWIDGSIDESSPFDNYDNFQVNENQIVGHYFRNLYQILKFIDESTLSNVDKVKYARILRAQLSSDEIAMLFFNCLSSKVDNGQFRSYVIKYKMLEHIAVKTCPHSDHVSVSTHLISVPLTSLDSYVCENGSAFGSNPVVNEYLKTKI
ncbi:putative phage abortive infection protein [Vibrio cholerae]|nr:MULTISPECIES: putative phage abortive infection protein [Vibrio]EGR1452139.1 hypothetical protein [Vibrio cholerae]EJL6291787.1 putative phage abortive infection protein [Vibrio cholerae]EJL6331999.1 putative phage abortive infection protein [Vibrio cholerae]EKF9632093.1 putative phage abortive infection protein [Vibrio cholerae]ELG5195343.1 putative phage abortive infection protein [Vibrio cholerae]